MKKFAKNFTLVIFSIAISIFAAEIVARLVAPQNLSGQWRIEAETGGYQLNKDHGESRHQIGDRVVHYNFGEHNLRVGPARPKASHRVLVLGDSFTFGWLLDWQDSYVGRLQKAVDDVFGPGAVEFLNAAVGGWGASDYVAYYEDYGNEVAIQTVLIFINTDDIGRILDSDLYSISAASEEIERAPPQKNNSIFKVLKRKAKQLPFYDFGLENSHLLQLIRAAAHRASDPPPGPQNPGRQPVESDGVRIPSSMVDDAQVENSKRLAKSLFRHIFRLAKERQHKLIILTTGWHKFGEKTPNEPTAVFMKDAAQFFKEEGIYFRDISDDVYRLSNGKIRDITIQDDGHPDELGALFISQAAWEVLSELLK